MKHTIETNQLVDFKATAMLASAFGGNINKKLLVVTHFMPKNITFTEFEVQNMTKTECFKSLKEAIEAYNKI